jgi:two-component system cell cycle response regulator
MALMPGGKILLVDDDPTILETLSRFLTGQGFAVVAAPSGREALAALQAEAVSLAILDLKLPDISGLELLAYVREHSPDCEVILFTGLGALDSAIQALRLGAYDYLVKSELRLPELHNVVERALERRRLALANRKLLEDLKRAQEELAATRARELTQIRRIGESLSRPLTAQEWVNGFLDLMWESLPLTLLGVRFKSQESLELSAVSRHLPDLPAEALEGFDHWLDLQLQNFPHNPAGELPLPPLCTAILHQGLQAEEVLGLVAAGRDKPFSAEEAELFRIFALQGEAALKNLLLFEEVKSLAIRDGLTGLYNYRYFHEVLTHQVQVSRRYGWPLSLLFMDIDDFKIINDTRGHPEGDLVLKALASFLKTHVRQSDMICRYGGEEFVVLMPQSSRTQAFHMADRLREEIAATPIALSHGQVQITVSIGVASLESPVSGENLVKTADAAMYQAKQSGKNRVCCPEEP